MQDGPKYQANHLDSLTCMHVTAAAAVLLLALLI